MIGSVRGFRAVGTVLVAAATIATLAGLTGPAGAAPTTTSGPAGPSGPTAVAQPKQTAVAQATKTAIHVAPTSLNLGHRRVGTFLYAQASVITNTGTLPLALNAIKFVKGTPQDFTVGTDCFPNRRPVTLAPGKSCLISAIFTPRDYGPRTATLSISSSAKPSPQLLKLSGFGTVGYFITGIQGGVATFGDAQFKGQMKGSSINDPIIAINPTGTGAGYWLTGTDGGVFAFGNAAFFGSTGSMRLSRPVVGMATLRNNKGYWLVGQRFP